MKLRRLLLACLPLLTLAVGLPLAVGQPGAPAFETQGAVSGAAETKSPHVAVDGATVHLAANSNRSDATYWSKADTAAFGASIVLGRAEGQPDYSTASLAVGPGGTLYYTWVNQTTRTISLRVKRPGGAWGEARAVVSGQPFPVAPQVAVTGDGAIVVTWRNPDRPFVYRRSTDGGLSWGSVAALSEEAGVNFAPLAAGPGGQLAAAYTGGESDHLQVYVALWDGTGFTRTRLTSLSGDYADPSLTFTPDGRLLVAWRGVAESGKAAGVFYAERQASGSFPVARLIGGKVAGRVSLSSDTDGNLHILWTSDAGGGYQLWYAVKPAMGAWSSPVAAPSIGGMVFNATGAGAVGSGGTVYAHAVSEIFVGTGLSLRHYRFRAGLTAAPALSARPLLEQGAARSRSAGTLAVSFTDRAGDPAEVRYRWGAAPTDADAWQPFATTMSVPAPALADPARCAEATLFTQVRAGTVIQAQALSDTITLDQAVQARVSAYHQGAAPGYTDEPALVVKVEDAGECSGFATVREVAEGADLAAITALPALLTVALPDQEGTYERAVEVADQIGNTRAVSVSVVYDKTDPAGDYPEPLAISPDPRASILQTIRLAAAGYDDGDDSLPWAVALVVSRKPIAPEAPDLPWRLYPLQAGHVAREQAAGTQDVTLRAEAAINLAELLPREALTPGVYHYALALVDPAGNPTPGAAQGRIELAAITYPTLYLPGVAR